MMPATLVLSILPLVALVQHPQNPPNEPPLFSVSVDLIKVPISVFDEHGAMVSDLRRQDLRVYEDGVEQRIRSFGIDRNPLSAVLLLDTSATVEKEIKRIKEAAETFSDALSKEDRVSIITFDDEPLLALDWTSDMGRVRKAVKRIRPGVRTSLYDAMGMAALQLRGIEGRKAIILLTDGLNNQSSLSFEDASRAIVQAQASLYVVSKTVIVREAARKQRRVAMLTGIYQRLFGETDYIDRFFEKREAEMTDLAEKTGGRCLFPTDYDQIRGVYAEVAHELKSKYYLTYVSNAAKPPDSWHEIIVEFFPPHSKIIHRRGYFHQPRSIREVRPGSLRTPTAGNRPGGQDR